MPKLRLTASLLLSLLCPTLSHAGTAGKALVWLGTIGMDNTSCSQFGGSRFNGESEAICEAISRGAARPGTNIGECRHYCSQCRSAFASNRVISQRDLAITYNSFLQIPNAVWSGMSLGKQSYDFIAWILDWSQSTYPTLERWLKAGENAAYGDNTFTRSMCIFNTLGSLAQLGSTIETLSKYGMGKGYEQLNETQLTTSILCPLVSVVTSCGVQLGISGPAAPYLAAARLTCFGGQWAASRMMCEQGRNCCLAAANMALGIRYVRNEATGQTAPTACCRCQRDVVCDRPWYSLKSDYVVRTERWGSVSSFSSYDALCEGREGKKFRSAVGDRACGGLPSYYRYRNCTKAAPVNGRCDGL